MISGMPITIPLLISFVLSLIVNSPFKGGQYRSKYLIVFIPALLSVAILALGAILRHDPTSRPLISKVAQYLILFLLATHIPIGGYIVYYMRGFRWFAVSVVLLQLWWSFLIGFVSLMSVTGDWL
jgi:hypothetical protein